MLCVSCFRVVLCYNIGFLPKVKYSWCNIPAFFCVPWKSINLLFFPFRLIRGLREDSPELHTLYQYCQTKCESVRWYTSRAQRGEMRSEKHQHRLESRNRGAYYFTQTNDNVPLFSFFFYQCLRNWLLVSDCGYAHLSQRNSFVYHPPVISLAIIL